MAGQDAGSRTTAVLTVARSRNPGQVSRDIGLDSKTCPAHSAVLTGTRVHDMYKLPQLLLGAE